MIFFHENSKSIICVDGGWEEEKYIGKYIYAEGVVCMENTHV